MVIWDISSNALSVLWAFGIRNTTRTLQKRANDPFLRGLLSTARLYPALMSLTINNKCGNFKERQILRTMRFLNPLNVNSTPLKGLALQS